MGMFMSVRRVGRVGSTVLDEGIYRTANGDEKVCAVVGRPDAVTVVPVRVMLDGERREETGWVVDRLHLLAADLYVSPGYTTERMSLFAATVTDDVVDQRAEDAQIVADWVPLQEALDATRDMKIVAALHSIMASTKLWQAV